MREAPIAAGRAEPDPTPGAPSMARSSAAEVGLSGTVERMLEQRLAAAVEANAAVLARQGAQAAAADAAVVESEAAQMLAQYQQGRAEALRAAAHRRRLLSEAATALQREQHWRDYWRAKSLAALGTEEAKDFFVPEGERMERAKAVFSACMAQANTGCVRSRFRSRCRGPGLVGARRWRV